MRKLTVSSSPHIKCTRTTRSIMLDVVIALAPVTISGCIIFGLNALLVLLATTLTAVASEFVFNAITRKKQTVGDFSAVITGLLLGLNMHADVPIWQCVIASIFAIIVVKCLFGGLGCNFANPAIAARVFILISFASTTGGGSVPLYSSTPELVSGATPLAVLSAGGEMPSYLDMLLGLRGGAIGETSIFCIIVGFIYLVVRRVIKFETPVIFVGTVFLLSLIVENSMSYAVYQILSGGLMLGAVFMATDYVTTPLTRSGKAIFALGCGILTFLIRYFGIYPEGVSFAILFMNLLSPYIERWTIKVPFGKKEVKK